VRGEVSVKPLPPCYMTYISSRIFWSFHTSYRVCLVPAESDSNGAYSAGAVAAYTLCDEDAPAMEHLAPAALGTWLGFFEKHRGPSL